MGQSLGCRDATEIYGLVSSISFEYVSKENELKVAVHMNGISVFQHSSLSTLSLSSSSSAFALIFNLLRILGSQWFIIRAAKDASGNFTGLMNCNPALISSEIQSGEEQHEVHQHHVSEQEDCD
jgi:hypothetical protein